MDKSLSCTTKCIRSNENDKDKNSRPKNNSPLPRPEGKFNWKNIILFINFIFLILYVIPFLIKTHLPSVYSYLIAFHLNNPNWYYYLTLFWIVLITSLYFYEFYLFILYCFDSNSVKVPKYAPKFIKDIYKNIEETSKLNLNAHFLNIYIKILRLLFIINLSYILFLFFIIK